MKRLFVKFEKDTGIVSALLKKGKPKYITQITRSHYEGKVREVSVIAQISSAFNEYLNHLWLTNVSVRSNSVWGRVNKFMVRKWVAQMTVANFAKV